MKAAPTNLSASLSIRQEKGREEDPGPTVAAKILGEAAGTE
jgi:hypothetical protein